ncbi:MAG: hypothetical protein JWN44_7057 [Myxococcales bacterium]|nr:hypothetical protein [Myxococcales bacterium]
MALVFKELHKPKSPDMLNDEWMLLENTGPNVVAVHKGDLTVARRATDRPHPLGTLDPGFILQPKEQIRLVTGTPSKKAQGAPPDEKEVKNYHLFLKEAVLKAPGVVVRVAIKQQELARAVFAPGKKGGIEEAE